MAENTVDKTELQWKEKLKQQQWFQELETMWNGLDSKQQQIAKWVGFGGLVLGLGFGIVTMNSMVSELETEVQDKEHLLDLVARAVDAGRTGQASPGDFNLRGLLASISGMQGLPENTLEVVDEKPQPAKGPVQEILAVVRAKGIQVRSLGDLLNAMDNPTQPIKIRNIEIETNSEESVLNAKLFVSLFQTVANPDPKEGTKK